MTLDAKQITKARKKKGWTKAKLAREADMNPSTIGQIENGRIKPYPSQLEKIARALGIEMS